MEFEHHDRVLILADGPSARPLQAMKIPASLYVIAVNGAIQWAPRADAFFTLDPSRRNRWLMANQKPGVAYFAAVPEDYGTPSAISGHRARAERHVKFLQRLPGAGPCRSRAGMCKIEDGISSGNSAWGALGLAHKMNPSRIGLAGVDGDTAKRLSGGTARDLSHIPWLFGTYDGPAEIRNGSPQSAVDCFPRCTVQELIKWLA